MRKLFARGSRSLASVAIFSLGLLAQDAESLVFGEPVASGAVGVVNGTPILDATWEEELVGRYLRPGAEGRRILASMEDECLIAGAANAKGLTVSEADIDKKCAELDAQIRASGGKSLADTLAENQVPMAVFREKTRGVTLLERLCRLELALPPETAVETLHQRAWLKQARETAKFVSDTAALPAGTLAIVNGRAITRADFARQLLIILEEKEIRKLLDTLVQDVIVNDLLRAQKIELSAADLEEEFALQRATFQSEGQDIPFEDLIRQQTGLDKGAFLATRGFRVKAALGKLAKAWFTSADLEQAYPSRASQFGPKITLRHILFAASENPSAKGKMPSFDEAKGKMALAQSDASQGMAFQDLVVKYSDDTATKFSGGLLRPFAPGRCNLDAAVVQAGSVLETGQMSGPVRSAFGWHLLRCEKREPLPPLTEVESDLRRLLAAERFKAAYETAKVGISIIKK